MTESRIARRCRAIRRDSTNPGAVSDSQPGWAQCCTRRAAREGLSPCKEEDVVEQTGVAFTRRPEIGIERDGPDYSLCARRTASGGKADRPLILIPCKEEKTHHHSITGDVGAPMQGGSAERCGHGYRAAPPTRSPLPKHSGSAAESESEAPSCGLRVGGDLRCQSPRGSARLMLTRPAEWLKWEGRARNVETLRLMQRPVGPAHQNRFATKAGTRRSLRSRRGIRSHCHAHRQACCCASGRPTRPPD